MDHDPTHRGGDAPTITRREQSHDAERLCLVVVGDHAFATHPLPPAGTVSIGRSDRNDVRIDDPSVSREHAVLHIDGDFEIEDLGSANGTSVLKRRLAKHERVTVRPDQVIDIGSTMVIVQRNASSRPRRLWTHDYFEARLEDECARCERTGASFAVLRLHLENPEAHQSAVQTALSEHLGSLDIVASYGPGEYEVLLFDAPPEKAEETTRLLRNILRAAGVWVRIGLAGYPSDGRNPEELIARACESVRKIRPPSSVEKPVIIEDAAMQELHRLVHRIAGGTISVMLLGETGVGKEIIAETVHHRSPRRSAPFVRLNCAALSESLLESELFGHEKGAFTGATGTKPGLLETAQGGTVFLDEVGELPLPLQAKLLRVIDERKVLRVGALTPRTIDVRFISATNRDLEQEVMRRSFRPDLFFRLNGISLVIPPLRERTSEIAPLARSFAEQLSAATGIPTPELSAEALALLEGYSWPGNIRELKNFIERAILLSTDGVIRPEHLPQEKMRATLLMPVRPRRLDAAAPAAGDFAADPDSVLGRSSGATYHRPDDALLQRWSESERRERQRIVETLERCGGNQTQAAKQLKVSRRTLVSRLDKYEIPRPRKPVGGPNGDELDS